MRKRRFTRRAASRRPLASINPPVDLRTIRSKSRSSSKNKKVARRRISVATSRGSEVENETIELEEALENVHLQQRPQLLELQKKKFNAFRKRILAHVKQKASKKPTSSTKKKREKKLKAKEEEEEEEVVDERPKFPLPFNPPVYKNIAARGECKKHVVKTPSVWFSPYQERRIRDFADVSETEKNMMWWWNEAVNRCEHQVTTKAICSPLLKEFARDRAADILSAAGGGICNFLRHAKVTLDRGLVDTTTVRESVQILLDAAHSAQMTKPPAARPSNGILNDQIAGPSNFKRKSPKKSEPNANITAQKEESRSINKFRGSQHGKK